MKKKVKSDWDCYGCSRTIFGSKNRCTRCGITREEAFSGGRSSDWECICGYKVFGSKDRCGKCKTTKEEASRGVLSSASHAISRAVSTDKSSTHSGGRPGDWECIRCRFLIFGSKDSCFKCGMSKEEASRGLSHDETKPPADRTRGTSSAPSGGRPGDWECPVCRFLIFGSKDTCKKCGTKRDDVKESEKEPEKESELCCVCLDAPKEVMLNTCKHFGFCEACAKKMKVCPICRMPYSDSDITKIFSV